MVFMHRNDGLSKAATDRIIKIRRALTLLIDGYLVFLVFGFASFSSHSIFKAVDEHKCTDDGAVQANVRLMRNYADNKLGASSGTIIMIIVFLILTLVIMIASFGYKTTVADKLYE